jgi:hypothetical protein
MISKEKGTQQPLVNSDMPDNWLTLQLPQRKMLFILENSKNAYAEIHKEETKPV